MRLVPPSFQVPESPVERVRLRHEFPDVGGERGHALRKAIYPLGELRHPFRERVNPLPKLPHDSRQSKEVISDDGVADTVTQLRIGLQRRDKRFDVFLRERHAGSLPERCG